MEGLTFAGRDGKDTLYKFRAFSDQVADSKTRVREIVLDHKVYFSRRSQLNDPFDIAPAFVLDKTGGEVETRKRLIADAKRAFERQGLSTPDINEKLALIAVRPLDWFETSARERVLSRLEDNYFVFSLAGNRTHPMMWSHYSDSHRGLCIHFSASEPSVFSAAMKINYDPVRPQVVIPLPVEKELLQKITLTKGNFWEYEDEYRLVRFPKQDVNFDDFGLKFETPQKALYKTPWITGITVGNRMTDSDVKEVIQMAKDHSPQLPVWKAQPTLTYELTFQQIA